MQKFNAEVYYSIGKNLGSLVRGYGDLAKADEKIIADRLTLSPKILKGLGSRCKEAGLHVSAALFDALSSDIESLDKIPMTRRELSTTLDHINGTIIIEMGQSLFMYIDQDRAKMYNKPELLGSSVNAKFPTVQFDVVEAGNCYAGGRGTAVVFHLMRIMETGVQAFGSKLGVPLTDQKVWQVILDGINAKIKGLPSKDPGTVKMSQASANLYAVKLAWRNEVMHPKDTYTLEEADNLIRQVKIFMEQLATII
jgi:hypothetical protein